MTESTSSKKTELLPLIATTHIVHQAKMVHDRHEILICRLSEPADPERPLVIPDTLFRCEKHHSPLTAGVDDFKSRFGLKFLEPPEHLMHEMCRGNDIREVYGVTGSVCSNFVIFGPVKGKIKLNDPVYSEAFFASVNEVDPQHFARGHDRLLEIWSWIVKGGGPWKLNHNWTKRNVQGCSDEAVSIVVEHYPTLYIQDVV